MNDDVNIDAIAHVTSHATASPWQMGRWLARQTSEVQAEVLSGFAIALKGLGSPAWQMQCAYIDKEWTSSLRGREIVSEVLSELTASATS